MKIARSQRWIIFCYLVLHSGLLGTDLVEGKNRKRTPKPQLSKYVPVGRPDNSEVDLLMAIIIPFTSSSVDFVTGKDGFPAFQLKGGSDIKTPYRLLFPATLFRNFAILATYKIEEGNEGFMFTVVNPSETVIQLGLKVSTIGKFQNITLYYTDVAMHLSSQILVSFLIPKSIDTWTRLALRIEGNNVTLYYNCEEYSSTVVNRIPKDLLFDTASTVYVGQAGSLIKGEFVGALQELKIYSNPAVAEVYCSENFQ
ncbi:collagen alpha-1(XV) chain-like, partial [Centruroides sculpturatus]|uniref:collagen alpha-1(XV) chain-like n=1 Tax=Centruroides sculpturatus TaxID=218467 RepID=UPI000C6ED6DE